MAQLVQARQKVSKLLDKPLEDRFLSSIAMRVSTTKRWAEFSLV